MITHRIGKTALALVAGCTLLAPAVPAGSQQGVAIQLFQFKPAQVEVRARSKVTWANQDDIGHTVTSGTPEQRDGRFDLPLDGKGSTAVVQLNEPGTYPYFCSRHQAMRGEIRVK
jgi:plastocyanin